MSTRLSSRMRRRGRPPKQRGLPVVKDGKEIALEGSVADRELGLVEVPVKERMDEVHDECDLTLNLMAPGSAMSSKQDQVGLGDREKEAKPFLEAVQRGRVRGGQMKRPTAACDQPLREDRKGKSVMPQGQNQQKVVAQRERIGKDGVWVVVKGGFRPVQVDRGGGDVGKNSRFQILHDETCLEFEGTVPTNSISTHHTSVK
ncbi:hypothetical protein Dimus_020847 [Dionaea muscipula]